MTPSNSLRQNEPTAAFATFSVRIQPRASKNEVVRMEGGGIKIRLTAPPVDGAANEALVKFLSDKLVIPKSKVEIVAGHTGREKIIRISGMGETDVIQLLMGHKK